ncbi:hypothetical protein [Comamonas sp.]|uniref:hypothetical protein n=1 Tax=Comamonas sp. TaxID=34028 RepID=UPI0028972051|nr:hypothetical protein [Comamonas sp.]
MPKMHGQLLMRSEQACDSSTTVVTYTTDQALSITSNLTVHWLKTQQQQYLPCVNSFLLGCVEKAILLFVSNKSAILFATAAQLQNITQICSVATPVLKIFDPI